MAGLSSPGIGSGLDVNTLVSKLMSVEQAPLTRLDTEEVSYQAKISALGNLKGSIASLQSSVAALNDPTRFTARTASSSDSTVLSGSASTIAAAGSYSVVVKTLAQAQNLSSSTGFATTTATVGTGSLTFKFGTLSGGPPATDFTLNPDRGTHTVTIDASHNTLGGIADAINAANFGVSASIINDGSTNGNRLVLTSTLTGAANEMKIEADALASPMAAFTFDPLNAGTSAMTENQAAQDATLTINGLAVSKASNTVTDAIHGVTLNLLKVSAGTAPNQTPTTLTVARDDSGTQAAVQSFVKAYNDAAKALADASAYDPNTKQAGPLQGDPSVLNTQSQLRSLLSKPLKSPGGGLTTLSDIGVAFQKDGSLALDSSKLAKVLADPTKDVSTLFAAVGKATSSLVTVSGSTSATQPGSYAINITTIATQGKLTGHDAVVNPTTITASSNDALSVVVDGISDVLTLTAGTYTPTQLAAEVQSRINGSSTLSSNGVAVSVSIDGAGKMVITSNRYGSASSVSVSGSSIDNATLGLAGGTATTGVDVAGSIGGVDATGSGQYLTATGNAAGLKLLINATAIGDLGSVNFSQGFAYQLNALTASFLDTHGVFASSTDSINASIKDIDRRRTDLQNRLIDIEARYRAQFNALDTLIASLQSTQSFLTQQLSSLSSLANYTVNSKG